MLESQTVAVRGTGNEEQAVNHITYNARQQKTAIFYANGSQTKNTYDQETFRIIRILTTRNTGQDVMQDLKYTFDAVGNITEQVDNAQQAQYFSNTIIDPTNKYRYDSLYRLVQATGREKGNLSAPNSSGYQPDWIPTNGKSSQSLATYCEQYSYDEVGNILELAHKDTCGGTENWKRIYVYNNNIINNYLLSAYTGNTPPSSPQFTYDAHGNMLQMPHLQGINWDFADQMKSSQKTGEKTYYVYSGGERVRKIVVDISGSAEKIKYERFYLGEYEVYHKYNTTEELETERVTHHCNDEGLVMLLQEIMTVNNGNSVEIPTTISRYQYGDQLDSAKLELNQNAEVLSYEEYHPFGTTSFEMHTNDSEVSLKRYKYVHKERDNETGLYYYGARYYAAWLGRFTAIDPLADKLPEWSSYVYTLNNPIKFTDPDGREPLDTENEFFNNSNSIEDNSLLNIKNDCCGEGKLIIGARGVEEVQKNSLQSLTTEFLTNAGNVLSLGSMALSLKSISKTGEIIVSGGKWHIYSKSTRAIANTSSMYFQTFGRIAGVATIGLDFLNYKSGRMSFGRFSMNSSWTAIGIWGGPFGFVASASYYIMGDVLGGHERAKEHFEMVQDFTPEEKRAWIKESLKNKRGNIKVKNPKL